MVNLQRPRSKTSASVIDNMSRRADSRPPATPAVASDPPTMTESVVESVTETVETIQQLPHWLAGGQPGEGSSLVPGSPVPAALVYVRVSRDFLEEYVERNVRRRKPVRDCVLGARITGESETRGRTQLTLLPSNGQLLGSIAFDGTVHARTTGRKGPGHPSQHCRLHVPRPQTDRDGRHAACASARPPRPHRPT